MDDSRVLGVRLTDEESNLIDEAARLAQQPGERGGASTWVRKVCLREARKTVDEFYAAVKVEEE